MQDDNYEMVPYKDILELRKDIADLKRTNSQEMVDSMKNLSSLMSEFIAIMKEAARGMSENDSGSFKNVVSKMDMIIAQNDKIADALVTIVDMLDKESSPNQSMQQQQWQVPQATAQPQGQAPDMWQAVPPAPNQPMGNRGLPEMDAFTFNQPPPTQGMPQFPEQKKGLFSKFRS